MLTGNRGIDVSIVFVLNSIHEVFMLEESLIGRRPVRRYSLSAVTCVADIWKG